MLPAVVIGACLGLLVALGISERLARDRAHRALPIRIHVNGTRGKSTITRLIWGALVEAGIPAVAKTTGTAPRLILPDGREHAVRRLAPASIREQLWLLGQARRAGARAVVAECMAIDPELQHVSEHEMLAATIGVITNVRTDHTEAMGSTLAEIAASMANTTPRGGVLVIGDTAMLDVFEARARQRGTRIVRACLEPQDAGQSRPPGADGATGAGSSAWQHHNQAVALAVTRELGIPDDVALRGMAKARPDPGAASTGVLEVHGRSVEFLDATAANDPESLDLLVEDATRGPVARRGPDMVIFNHRHDRPLRLDAFARASRTLRNAEIVVTTGDPPAVQLTRRLRRARHGRPSRVVGRRHLRSVVTESAETREIARVIFCGNTRGFDMAAVTGHGGRGGGGPLSARPATEAREETPL